MKRFYNLDVAPTPFTGQVFDLVVCSGLKNILGGDDNYLSIGYVPERKDGIYAIQASPMTGSGDDFRVELVVHGYDGRKFHIYAQNYVSFDDTLDLFYRTCVLFETPEYLKWEDVTDSVTLT